MNGVGESAAVAVATTKMPTTPPISPTLLPSSPKQQLQEKQQEKPTTQNSSWLLRFFESKHFDMSIAISYLFYTKEPGVQTYLCNRLFTFDNEQVNTFLPIVIIFIFIRSLFIDY